MIHEIKPRRLNGAFRILEANDEDFVLFFSGGRCILPAGRELANLTRLTDFPPPFLEREGRGALEYLFSIESEHDSEEAGGRFFLLLPENLELAEQALLKEGWKAYPAEIFRKFPESYLGFAGVTARHISLWREKSKFCGRCGARTIHSRTERAALCPACSLAVYPSIMPAVITAVHDGERLLMVKSARASYRHFALVAGYVETGETLEQTVRREVAEETGLKVKNIRYFGNQPWGFSCTQMIAFSAELDGSPEITLQTEELEAAAWFPRKDIPLPPDLASIGGEMIRRFKERGAKSLCTL